MTTARSDFPGKPPWKKADGMYNKTCLENGVRIISERLEHLQSVSLGIWVSTGSRDEDAARSGISHFIEHMVFKGTKRRTGMQIAKEFDSIGGHSNAFTGKEHTCYHARVLDRHLGPCADLIADMVLNPTFDAGDLERERQVVLQEISMVEDTPDDVIHELLGRLFWAGHPLGMSVLGSGETVSTLDRQGMLQHMCNSYVPGTILVTAAGNVDHDDLVSRFRVLLGHLEGRGDLPVRSSPEPHGAISCNDKDLEQVHICLGAPAPSQKDESRYACSVFNTILGGNMSSRLFQEVREKRGLAYSVFSFVSSYQDAGLAGVYAATDRERVNDLLGTVKGEIDMLIKGGLSPEELEAAKEYLIGSMRLSAESSDHLMSRLARSEFLFGHHVSFEEIEDGLRRVSIGDVARVACSAFCNDKVSLVTLGPFTEKAIDRGILDFGR